MNSNLSYLILILLILLIIYFIVKIVINKRNLLKLSEDKLNLNDLNNLNNIEQFSSAENANGLMTTQSSTNLSSMQADFGLDIEANLLDFNPAEYNSSELEEALKDYFYHITDSNYSVTSTDPHKSNGILSKYLGIYNLLTLDLSHINSDILDRLDNDLSNSESSHIKPINTYLEDGFYKDELKEKIGFIDVNFSHHSFNGYLSENSLKELINSIYVYPKSNKFENIKFIDFGKKNRRKLNIYIKNARYLIDDNDKMPPFSMYIVSNLFNIEGFDINNIKTFADISKINNNDVILELFNKPSDYLQINQIINNKINTILDDNFDAIIKLPSGDNEDEPLFGEIFYNSNPNPAQSFKSMIFFNYYHSDSNTYKYYFGGYESSNYYDIFIYEKYILCKVHPDEYYYHKLKIDKIYDFTKTGSGTIEFKKINTANVFRELGIPTIRYTDSDDFINAANNNFIDIDAFEDNTHNITLFWRGKFQSTNVLSATITNGEDDEINISQIRYYHSYYVITSILIEYFYLETNTNIDYNLFIFLYKNYKILMLVNEDNQVTNIFVNKGNASLNENVNLTFKELSFDNYSSIEGALLRRSDRDSLLDDSRLEDFADDGEEIILNWVYSENFTNYNKQNIEGFTTSMESSNKSTYINQFKREITVLYTEYFFALFALLISLSEDNLIPITNDKLDSLHIFLIENTPIFNNPDIFAHNLNYIKIIFLLLKLRNNIINDKILDKFNCKYMTYLFYSFKKGWMIFGDYIKRTLDKDQNDIMQIFFENYQFEGLYKLFIMSINKNCFLYYEFESDKDKIQKGFSIAQFLDEGVIDFNQRQFFFYQKNNFDELDKQCKDIEMDNCTKLSTQNLCVWDSNNNKCSANRNNSLTCFDNSDETSCQSNDDCNWNSENEICSPKNCISDDGVTCKYDSISHCNQFTYLNNTKCYDENRVMYTTQDNISERKYNPNNFFTIENNSHLNKCLDETYDNDTNEYAILYNGKCENLDNCNLLKKNTVHNKSEFRACVNDDLIKFNKFYSCHDLKTEQECDSQTENLMNCFWQDGQCHNRDAPPNWITPGSNSFGLEDMTDCQNFISEFSCPEDRCIWLNNECMRKENHPKYQNQPQELNVTSSSTLDQPEILMKREIVDCDSINKLNGYRENADLKDECLAYNCKFQDNKCVNNIGRSCALNYTKTECLDINKNYDLNKQQNSCRWSENQTNIFNNDAGYCTDTRMKQPCGLFTKDNCPTELKIDNFGNKIYGSNHCKIEDNKCKINNNASSNTFDDCHFNYLNNGDCSDNCQLIDLNSIEVNERDESYSLKKCVHKERLPCPHLSQENCALNNENCYIDETDNNNCKTLQPLKDMNDVLDKLTNNSSYDDIMSVSDEFSKINLINNENKKYFLKNTNSIFGFVLKLESNDTSSSNIQKIYTNSDRLLSINKNDFIYFKKYDENDDIKLIPDTRINKFVVVGVDSTKGIISIKNKNSNGIMLSINEELNIDLQENNSLTNKIIWEVENPNIGLFDSYQYAQAIEDSLKINDFYKNLF